MSIHLLNVKGVGPIAFGLDWVRVSRFDNPDSKIKADASANKARWLYYNKDGKKDFVYYTLLGKAESKQKPIAASTLLANLVDRPTFLAFQKIDEDRFWVVANTEGAPAYKKGNGNEWTVVDVVQDSKSATEYLARLVLSLDADVPIVTNVPEMLQSIIGSHAVFDEDIVERIRSAKKKDTKGAYFTGYSGQNYWKYIIPAIVGAAGIGYYVTDQMDAAEQARRAKVEQAKQVKLRKEQLASEVETNLNSKKNVVGRADEIFKFLDTVPKQIEGWKAKEITCDSSLCIIDFNGSNFATWIGYSRHKPAAWPEPDTSNDILKVKQQVMVESSVMEQRQQDELQDMSKVIFELGNLAQLARVANVTLTIKSEPQPIAGTEDDKWIPRQLGISATGPAHLAKSFITRLPKNTGLDSMRFALDEVATFELNGYVYAKN